MPNWPEIAQNANPGLRNFWGRSPHTPQGGGPPPTPTLTWHCEDDDTTTIFGPCHGNNCHGYFKR